MSALFAVLHPSDQMAGFWVMASAGALLAANVYVIARIGRRLAPGSRLVPFFAGLATALYYPLVSWSLTGMETGLLALLYSGAVLCALRSNDPTVGGRTRRTMVLGCGLLLSLAVLTRDDALVVVVVVLGFGWIRLRPRTEAVALIGGPVLLAVVGHELFRLAYYGLPLPNTYYLKLDGIPLLARLSRGLLVVFQNATLQLVVPLLLVIAYGVLIRRGGRRLPTGSGLLLGILIAQTLYTVYVGGDSYDDSLSDRFLVSVVPFLLVLAVMGARELAQLGRRSAFVAFGGLVLVAGLSDAVGWFPTDRLQERVAASTSQINDWADVTIVIGVVLIACGILPDAKKLSSRVIGVGLAVLLLVGIALSPLVNWYEHNTYFLGVDVINAQSGAALAATTGPDTTVGVVGAGDITFFDHRPSIDLLGYSDHVVATTVPHMNLSSRPGHEKWDYAYSIGRLRPDIVFGLFLPTKADTRHMAEWGYRSNVTSLLTIYYLPGTFHPGKFLTASVNFEK
jgi:hypothetical protein